MSSFPIPLLMIKHNLFFDPTITKVDHLAQAITNDPDTSRLTVTPATEKTTMALWEMARVNVMINRDPALTRLYTTWIDLGYANTLPHVLIHSETNTRPLNIKLSMLLGKECFGTWALSPLEVWNIAI